MDKLAEMCKPPGDPSVILLFLHGGADAEIPIFPIIIDILSTVKYY